MGFCPPVGGLTQSVFIGWQVFMARLKMKQDIKQIFTNPVHPSQNAENASADQIVQNT